MSSQIPRTGAARSAGGRISGPGAGTPRNEAGEGRPIGELSDAGLVMALNRGGVDALAEAYRRHGPSVYGLIGPLCGAGQAEEVTQAVFLRLWHSPANFGRGTGSLRPMLVAEAHRRAVGLLRADTARQAREAAVPADDLEQKVLPNGANDASGGLLAGLSRTARQAIVLAYFGGYTRRQVASLVRRPAKTVNADIRTGISRLHANLTADGRRPPSRPPASLESSAP